MLTPHLLGPVIPRVLLRSVELPAKLMLQGPKWGVTREENVSLPREKKKSFL